MQLVPRAFSLEIGKSPGNEVESNEVSERAGEGGNLLFSAIENNKLHTVI